MAYKFNPLTGRMDMAGGAATTPAGSDGYVQFNASGVFGASEHLRWDNASDRKRFGVQVATPLASGHFAASIGSTVGNVSGQSNTQLAESLVSAPTGTATQIARPAAPGSGSASYANQGSGGFTGNGQTFNVRVYTCLYDAATGAEYKSTYYADFSVMFPNDFDSYDLAASWDAVSISGETAHYFVEVDIDGGGYNALGVFTDPSFTVGSISGSDTTTPWPTLYKHVSASGPDAPVSLDSATQQYDGSNSYYYASGQTILYEIDTYKDIGGTKYVSGAPVAYNGGGGFTDDNSGNYYYVDLSWSLTGTYDGVILRKSTDGGSSWSYIDVGSTGTYSDQNFADDGVSSGRWGQTYTPSGSTTFTFRPHGRAASPSATIYFGPAGSDYSAVVTDAYGVIIRHSFSGMPSPYGAKILADVATAINYGKVVTANFLDPYYTAWGDGSSTSPSSYGWSGSNQIATYGIYALLTQSGTTIESQTVATVSVSNTGGTKYNSLSWSAVAGATGYKITRSINGGTTFMVTVGSGTTSLIDDALRSWSALTSYGSSIVGTAFRADRNSTAKADNPIVEIVAVGSGTLYPKLSFGVASSSASTPTYVAHLIVESVTGYMDVVTGRLNIAPSIGATPSSILGNAVIFNNNNSSSVHPQIKGQSNQYVAYSFSPHDTLYIGNYTGVDEQAAMVVQPFASGDAGVVFRGHASQSATSTAARFQTSAGSYTAYITVGGYFWANTGSASNPGVACGTDQNTGIAWLTADNLSFITGGTERGRWHSLGLAIGLTSSFVGQLHVKGTSSGSIQLVLDQASGQTADQLRFRNSSGTVLTSVASNGYQIGLNTGGAYGAMLTIYTQGGQKTQVWKSSGGMTADHLEVQSSAGSKIAGITASGVFQAADGSAAAPGQTFAADTDNGFYRIGANNWGASVGGTLRMDWDTARLLFADGYNIQFATATGTKVGTANTQKIGFWGVAPVAQQSLSAYTSDGEGSAYSGIDNLQVGNVYAQVSDLNQLRVAYETLRAAYDDLRAKVINTGIVA